jgi:hypothetical protein
MRDDLVAFLEMVGSNCWSLVESFMVDSFSSLRGLHQAQNIIEGHGGLVRLNGNVLPLIQHVIDSRNLENALGHMMQAVHSVCGTTPNEAVFVHCIDALFIDALAQCNILHYLDMHNHALSSEERQFDSNEHVFSGQVECLIDSRFVFEGKSPKEKLDTTRFFNQFMAEMFACAKRNFALGKDKCYGIYTNFDKVMFGWTVLENDEEGNCHIVVNIDPREFPFNCQEMRKFIRAFLCSNINSCIVRHGKLLVSEEGADELQTLKNENAKLKKEIDKLKAYSDKEIDFLETQHIQDMERLKTQHIQDMERLETQHIQDMERLKKQHIQDMERLETQHIQDMERLKKQHIQDMERMRQDCKQKISRLKNLYENEQANDEMGAQEIAKEQRKRNQPRAVAAVERPTKRHKFEENPSSNPIQEAGLRPQDVTMGQPVVQLDERQAQEPPASQNLPQSQDSNVPTDEV